MDRRIAKTQKALVHALGECLSKHSWDQVSVQLICDTADVSRSTFYAHFESKQDLLAMAVKVIARTLVDDDTEKRSLRRDRKIKILPALLRHMRSHLFLFESSRSSMAGRALAHHFETTIGQEIRAEIAQSQFAQTLTEDHIVFLIGGIFALLDHWRDNGCALPDAEVLRALDLATELVLAGQTQ